MNKIFFVSSNVVLLFFSFSWGAQQVSDPENIAPYQEKRRHFQDALRSLTFVCPFCPKDSTVSLPPRELRIHVCDIHPTEHATTHLRLFINCTKCRKNLLYQDVLYHLQEHHFDKDLGESVRYLTSSAQLNKSKVWQITDIEKEKAQYQPPQYHQSLDYLASHQQRVSNQCFKEPSLSREKKEQRRDRITALKTQGLFVPVLPNEATNHKKGEDRPKQTRTSTHHFFFPPLE